MEAKHLSYFKVENFKRFDSLEVNDIGQFNLIVGDNNVGKTTLLEALLFDEDFKQWQQNLWEVLRYYREILVPDNRGIHYANYYLRERNKKLYIQYANKGSDKQNYISLNTRNLESLSSTEVSKIQHSYAFRPNVKLLTEFSFNDTKEIEFVPNENEFVFFKDIPFLSFYLLNDIYAVDTYSMMAVDTQKKSSLINDLKYFIPNLIDIEINIAMVPDRAIIGVREIGKDLIPLSQYGDGTAKFFRYLLELDRFSHKRLMLDEIDTGIHHSRMKDFLKKVIQTAKNKNVQLFATTHSKECLEYYSQALQELGLEGEGRIIKLANTKSGIKSYTMKFAEFENALYIENEIR